MGTLSTRKMFLRQIERKKNERKTIKVENLKFSEELDAVAIYQFNNFSRCKIEKLHLKEYGDNLSVLLFGCVDKQIFLIYILNVGFWSFVKKFLAIKEYISDFVIIH